MEEGSAKGGSAKSEADVEEVGSERRQEAAVRRRNPDIGAPANRAAGERVVRTVARDTHRIDPEGRVQIIVETEIRGRKADCPATPVAGGDAAVDLPEAAEQCGRLVRLAGLEQLADMGRGIDDRILPADRLEHGHLEAVLQTGRAQRFGRPPAAVAEGAIPADPDMPGPDRSDDDVADEF